MRSSDTFFRKQNETISHEEQAFTAAKQLEKFIHTHIYIFFSI